MTFKTGSWGKQAKDRSKQRDWRNNNERLSRNYKKLRIAVLEKYGPKCKDCGFDDIRALQIDHVNNNGSQERRKKIAGQVYLMKVFRNEDGEYQILCANCNVIKREETRQRNHELKIHDLESEVKKNG